MDVRTDPAGEVLFLSFPQWQGAGFKEAMGESSSDLPKLLPEFSWLPIPIIPDSSPEMCKGIRGRDALLSQLRAASTTIRHRAPRAIFTLGGDCGVELAPVAYLASVYRDELGVVWLDAHPDLSTPETSLTHNLHGMVLLSLFGDGDPDFVGQLPRLLAPEKVVLAGVREVDPHEEPLLTTLPLRNVSCEELHESSSALADAVAEMGVRYVYVHLDLDVLEPSLFASIAFPTPDGLNPSLLLRSLEELKQRFDIVGLCVTEFVARRPEDGKCVARFVRTLAPKSIGGSSDVPRATEA